jgi:hypothetical protein
MPTNTQITAALLGNNVPPDRECIRNATDVVAVVQDFVSVVLSNVEATGGATDSIAQQALQQSAVALATAQQALAAAPNRRTSGEPLAVTAGDSTFNISWSPAMPDTNYEVRATYFGTNVAVATFYAFRVVDGSRTVNGCQLRLDNTPSNTKLSWVVEAL